MCSSNLESREISVNLNSRTLTSSVCIHHPEIIEPEDSTRASIDAAYAFAVGVDAFVGRLNPSLCTRAVITALHVTSRFKSFSSFERACAHTRFEALVPA